MDLVVGIKQDKNVWGLSVWETEGRETELEVYRQKYKSHCSRTLSSLGVKSAVFPQDKWFLIRRNPPTRGTPKQSGPDGLHKSKLNPSSALSIVPELILGLSAHIWRSFLFLPLHFVCFVFFGLFVILQAFCGGFLACTHCWCLDFFFFHLLGFVGERVCVWVRERVSQLSVEATTETERWGKESQAKVSAGHHGWEQIVWRTWQGLAAFSLSVPVDLSGIWDSLFVSQLSSTNTLVSVRHSVYIQVQI